MQATKDNMAVHGAVIRKMLDTLEPIIGRAEIDSALSIPDPWYYLVVKRFIEHGCNEGIFEGEESVIYAKLRDNALMGMD